MATATTEKRNKKSKGEKKPLRKNPQIPELVGIGRRVLQARESRGMTQNDLAEKMETTTQDIGQVENGWRSLSVTRVHFFAKHLGVTAEWLFTGINLKVYAALVTNVKKLTKAVDSVGEGDGTIPA